MFLILKVYRRFEEILEFFFNFEEISWYLQKNSTNILNRSFGVIFKINRKIYNFLKNIVRDRMTLILDIPGQRKLIERNIFCMTLYLFENRGP